MLQELGERKIKGPFRNQILAIAGFNEKEVAKYDLAENS